MAYAAPDLGSSYQNATGNSSDTSVLSVENCGNMLIMAFAHALKSGEGYLIRRHHALLQGWADYLVTNTFQPGFVTADGLSSNSSEVSTNLALKGVLGIYAMSRISDALGLADDVAYYMAKASDYSQQWESIAFTRSGEPSSSGLLYNLYAARLLGAEVVRGQVYEIHAELYASQIASAPHFGLAYDSQDPGKAKAHWTLFAAASLTDNTSIADSFISMVHSRAFYNNASDPASSVPFPATYNPQTGAYLDGSASPAVGAMFSLLALRLPNLSITFLNSHPPTRRSLHLAVIGVCVVVSFILFCLVCYLHWQRQRRDKQGKNKLAAVPYTVQPLGVDPSRPVVYYLDSAREGQGGAEREDKRSSPPPASTTFSRIRRPLYESTYPTKFQSRQASQESNSTSSSWDSTQDSTPLLASYYSQQRGRGFSVSGDASPRAGSSEKGSNGVRASSALRSAGTQVSFSSDSAGAEPPSLRRSPRVRTSSPYSPEMRTTPRTVTFSPCTPGMIYSPYTPGTKPMLGPSFSRCTPPRRSTARLPASIPSPLPPGAMAAALPNSLKSTATPPNLLPSEPATAFSVSLYASDWGFSRPAMPVSTMTNDDLMMEVEGLRRMLRMAPDEPPPGYAEHLARRSRQRSGPAGS